MVKLVDVVAQRVEDQDDSAPSSELVGLKQGGVKRVFNVVFSVAHSVMYESSSDEQLVWCVHMFMLSCWLWGNSPVRREI